MGAKFSSLTPLLTWLRQPPAIATLISVGAHAVLFGLAPTFSSVGLASLGNDGGTGEERNVPLIELTPEEQSRLPDFSGSAYSFVPDSGDSEFDLLVPNEPGAPSQASPFPPSAGLPPMASQPEIPLFPVPSPSPLVIRPRSPLSIVPPPRRAAAPRMQGNSRNTRETPQPSGNRPSNGNTPSAASTPTTREGPDEPVATGTADDLLPRIQRRPTGEAPADSQTDSQTEQDAEGDGEEPVASAPLNNDREDTAEASDQPPVIARIQAMAYNPEGTSEEAAAEASTAWLENIQAETEASDLAVAEEPLPMVLPYEGRVCLDPPPGEGLVGAWVTAEGELAEDPVLLKSTGYPFLNEQALATLAEAEFPEADTAAVYQFAVEIEYDAENCIKREDVLSGNS